MAKSSRTATNGPKLISREKQIPWPAHPITRKSGARWGPRLRTLGSQLVKVLRDETLPPQKQSTGGGAMGLGRAGAGRVQILKRVNAERMIDQRTNATGRGLRCGKRCNAGDFVTHGSAPDRFFVVKGLAAEGRINDQIDATGFDQIDDVGAAFVSLVDGFGRYTRRG